MSWVPWQLLIVLCLAGFTLIVPTFQSEHPTSDEGPSVTLADHLPLSKRLGYATLSDLGVINVKLNYNNNGPENDKVTEKDKPLSRSIDAELIESNPYSKCDDEIEYSSAAFGDIDNRLLTLAIAASENYNRTFLRRKIELLTQSLFIWVGLNADFTLGLTQLKLSGARESLQRHLQVPLSNREVVKYLSDDCDAMQATAWWLEDEARRMKQAGQRPSVERLAVQYNGGIGYDPSEFSYAKVVRASYDVLKDLVSSQEDAGEVKPKGNGYKYDALGCVFLDNWGGSIQDEKYYIVQDGKVTNLARQEFGERLRGGPGLELHIRPTPAWVPSLRDKLLHRADGVIGVSAGHWEGVPVRSFDDVGDANALYCLQHEGDIKVDRFGQDHDEANDLGVVAVLRRPGSSDVFEAWGAEDRAPSGGRDASKTQASSH
jgi:hypothetical protein